MSSEQPESASGQQYWGLVEPVWDEIEIYSGPEEFSRTFAGVPRPAGLLFAAHFCQSEICNGGFKQFFYNSTGVVAPEAIEGFKAIAQASVAEIVQEACSLFGEPFPRERSLRQSKLAAIDSALLDSLDQKFYAILDKESGGFEAAADAYAAKVRESDPI
jgi:Domain of unknown function (DUF4375)